MALRIIRTDHNGLNGHITMLVRIEEEAVPGQVTHGPEETIGIWPRALMTAYHGDGPVSDESVRRAIQKWLHERHAEILERKRHSELTARSAHSFKGKLVEFNALGVTK